VVNNNYTGICSFLYTISKNDVSSKTLCALELGLGFELGLRLRLRLAEMRFRSNAFSSKSTVVEPVIRA